MLHHVEYFDVTDPPEGAIGFYMLVVFAKSRFVCSEVLMEPTVRAEPSMKDRSPTRTVLVLQIGFHVSGWKSDMERQRRVPGVKRPDGVSMTMRGGFSGYSGGKVNLPW